MTMKLTLYFVAMDLLTLLIYPLVYVHGVFNRFLNRKEKATQANALSLAWAVPD